MPFEDDEVRVTPSKKRGPKHVRRLRAAENFISAYVALSEDGKVNVEQFLALSAYDCTKLDHYTPGSKRHGVDSVAEHSMCYWVKMTIFDQWSAWAEVIKRAQLGEFERQEAVREMLGALISMKNKSSLTEPELRVAAEKALEWTRHEERNIAMSRVMNSPDAESCIKAIAWEKGKDREEATRRLAALVSKAFV